MPHREKCKRLKLKTAKLECCGNEGELSANSVVLVVEPGQTMNFGTRTRTYSFALKYAHKKFLFYWKDGWIYCLALKLNVEISKLFVLFLYYLRHCKKFFHIIITINYYWDFILYLTCTEI